MLRLWDQQALARYLSIDLAPLDQLVDSSVMSDELWECVQRMLGRVLPPCTDSVRVVGDLLRVQKSVDACTEANSLYISRLLQSLGAPD